MPSSRGRLTGGAALLGVGALTVALLNPFSATAEDQTERLTPRPAPNGTMQGAFNHMIALEEIADANNGTRASGTPGYDASVDYVVKRMKRAGYVTKRQAFDFPFFQQTGPSTFERTAPAPAQTYTEEEDYALMTYSGSEAVVDTPVQAVDAATVDGSTSGCEDADFVGFTTGSIALIRRGTCTFGEKALNAQEAGASAVIVFNQGNSPDRTGVVAGTLGAPDVTIPVIGTTTAIGDALSAPDTRATVEASTISEIRETYNVIAQTRKGDRKNVVMAGAHLDSVAEGEGINDNGSGSAALLETAEAMAKGQAPKNKVRFTWWGAEELGLLGSEHYVTDLSENRPARFQNIALYLNFDMVSSPNYILGVYDGNNNSFPPEQSATAPEGSAAIERTFHRFFDKLGTDSVDTAFSGRSDYGPFIALNVPAGGLFTGAEGIKTAEEAALFGGRADAPYDECYHQDCDDLGNVNRKALGANLKAIMKSMAKYARSTSSVNGDETGHTPPPPVAARKVRNFDAHGHHGVSR